MERFNLPKFQLQLLNISNVHNGGSNINIKFGNNEIINYCTFIYSEKEQKISPLLFLY
jgi:hypothetical protein